MGASKPATDKGTTRVTAKASATARLAEERLQAVLSLCADFYWEQDDEYRFALCRPATHLSDDLGDDPSDDFSSIIGKTCWELSASPPDGAASWDAHRAALTERAPFRDVVLAVATEHGPRYVSFSGAPLFDQRRRFKGYRGVAQDVSARFRTDHLARLERLVTRTLAETLDIAAGVRAALQAMCESERWTAAAFWSVDERAQTLRKLVSWSAEGGEARSLLADGDSLPHWLRGGPVWIGDVHRDPRTKLMERVADEGWTSSVLVPLRAGGATIGVLDFCAPRIAAPEPQFLRVLRVACAELAHFYQRALVVERLRDSEERYSSTMELAAIGIAHVDEQGQFLYANPQLCEMLGYTEAQLLALTVRQISHPNDVTATDELRVKLRAGAIKSFKIEKRYLRKDGVAVWVNLTVASRRDRDGALLHDISIIEDISARKRAEERVQYLATHDGLTGLPNRAMFGQILNLAIESARRYQRKFAVLFIDLDRFKVINDTLGHEAGDVLLREMGARLRESLRASDVVARLGGDEFVVLTQEVSDSGQVGAVARSILSAIMKPVLILGQECRVTASIGVCVHPQEGQDDQSVMKNADIAMYLAKEEGKNTYQFFSNRMRAHSIERLTLETNLRRALELNEFSLHYQAKVNFKTGKITGVEALLRWHSPALGQVSPTHFIPLAEETGMIVPIGRWVMRTACAQSVAWQKEGLPRVRTSVNLSMRQLHDEGIVREIAAVLRETGLDPDLLEFEITESMIMHNAERSVRILNAIKQLGVRLAIDDFGTGYSSLAHLKRFPIDTLKVDRSFIREVPDDAEDRAIAEAIIAMGKTLSLTVVAEGVETPQQQAFLSERACDEMQGYFFSLPIAAQDFALLLREHTPQPLR